MGVDFARRPFGNESGKEPKMATACVGVNCMPSGDTLVSEAHDVRQLKSAEHGLLRVGTDLISHGEEMPQWSEPMDVCGYETFKTGLV